MRKTRLSMVVAGISDEESKEIERMIESDEWAPFFHGWSAAVGFLSCHPAFVAAMVAIPDDDELQLDLMLGVAVTMIRQGHEAGEPPTPELVQAIHELSGLFDPRGN